ncbi:uncharacterized protein LOC119401432 isoform X1 [Rhipicephalus sanguineus]|uniref:uncharacterized protein LOC119401432 isoform X1 n=1 Tax=Rhipicephalus sanguineus TaxID=34632 RepID=UPI00189328A3|nr:uncharacterized protein LOC119401432 isoform X1 [Rhipicephalus sanguineus]
MMHEKTLNHMKKPAQKAVAQGSFACFANSERNGRLGGMKGNYRSHRRRGAFGGPHQRGEIERPCLLPCTKATFLARDQRFVRSTNGATPRLNSPAVRINGDELSFYVTTVSPGAQDYIHSDVHYTCELGICDTKNDCIPSDLFMPCWKPSKPAITKGWLPRPTSACFR